MLRRTTQARSIQESPTPQPNIFDKVKWLLEISNGQGLSKGAVATALRLVGHHNDDDGQCNPSIQTLTDALGGSTRTTMRELEELRDAGFIEWIKGRNHQSNSYTLRNVRIGNHKGMTAGTAKASPAKLRPATKRKGPASQSGSNVVRFPGSAPLSVPDLSPCSMTPVSPCNLTPMSKTSMTPVSHELMNSYLTGKSEEATVEEKKETEGASVSPASPLCLDGDGPSRIGENEKQPELVSQPTDGKFTFDQLSPEWKVRARDWAEVQFYGDKTFIDQASKGFKAVAIERQWRLTEDKWHEVWLAYSMQERSKRPAPKLVKGQMAI